MCQTSRIYMFSGSDVGKSAGDRFFPACHLVSPAEGCKVHWFMLVETKAGSAASVSQQHPRNSSTDSPGVISRFGCLVCTNRFVLRVHSWMLENIVLSIAAIVEKCCCIHKN